MAQLPGSIPLMAELFRFTARNITGVAVQEWRYTNARAVQTFGPLEFAPRAISRSRWKRDLGDAELVLKVPPDMPPVPLYVAENPANNIWLEIFAIPDDEGDQDPASQFIGKVAKASFDLGGYSARLRVTAASRLLNAEVPRWRYSRGCRWNLYEWGCFLSPIPFKLALPFDEVELVETADGQAVRHASLALQPDGYYSNGFVDIGGQRCFVTQHAGTDATLMARFLSPSGAFFDVYPGCDKTRTDCETKFNNKDQFGGFPYIPLKNPTTDGL